MLCTVLLILKVCCNLNLLSLSELNYLILWLNDVLSRVVSISHYSYVTWCIPMSYNLICVKSVCTLWKRPLIDEKMLRAAVEAKTRILATLLLGSNCVFLGFSGSPSLSLQLPFPLKVNSRRPLQKRSGGKKRECWVIPNCSHLKTREEM